MKVYKVPLRLEPQPEGVVLSMNWLRVLGTAELPYIDQGVRHQFHAKMALLQVFETQEEPLEFILPGESPIDTSPQGMASGIEEPLGALAIAGILWDVRDHAGIENALAIVRGIKSGVEIQIGSCEDQPDYFSDLLQGFQTLRQQPHVGLIDGSHGEWRQHIAVIVGHGDDWHCQVVDPPSQPVT